MYIRTYSINYSTTLIIIIVIIIHTIQYIYYNYRHTKYDICLHYTVSCEEAMLYTNSCIYYTMLYYVYMYARPIPLWYMTMYITSHTILIYYNNYYYDNSNYYLFLFLLLCCCMCVRVCACIVLCCVISLVCMCALLCVLAYAHTCVSVCVYPASPSQTVLWWRGWCVDIGGGIFREKIFTKFGKWVYQVKTDRKSIFDLRKR